jgi:hypothetical protein
MPTRKVEALRAVLGNAAVKPIVTAEAKRERREKTNGRVDGMFFVFVDARNLPSLRRCDGSGQMRSGGRPR